VYGSFMPSEPTIAETIADAVATPASVTSDGTTVVARSIPDLIAADKHLTAKAAAAKPAGGWVMRKVSSPGGLG